MNGHGSSGRMRSRLAYDPFLPAFRANPYPLYARLREHEPVHFSGPVGAWCLTRYEDCARVLQSAGFSARLGQQRRQRPTRLPSTMLNSDPPDHRRLLRPFADVFSARSVQRLRPILDDVAQSLLEHAAKRREIEVLSELGVPVATRALAELLDIPSSDRAWFESTARAAGANMDPLASPAAARRGNAATASLHEYFARSIAERRRDPRRDWIGQVAGNLGDQGITADELVATLVLFVVGGHEPTVHLIANSVLALVHHPDELHRLRRDPTLIVSGIDELARYDGPIPLAARVATEEKEIGGRTVRRGEVVIALLAAANRDPAQFADPDRLDLARTPNPHLGFGGGPHVCLGAGVARTAAQVAVTALVARFPEIRLAAEKLEWVDAVVPRGLQRLRLHV